MRSISKQLMLAMLVILLVFGGVVVTVLLVEIGSHENNTTNVIEMEAAEVLQRAAKDNLTEEDRLRMAAIEKDPYAYAERRMKEMTSEEDPQTYGSDMLLISLMLEENNSTFHGKLVRYIIISFLIAIVVCDLFIYLLSRRIAKPIKELAAQAAIIGSGDLDHPIHVNTKNEVGQLAESFQAMTDALKKQMNQIEKDTAVREHELAGRETARQIKENVRYSDVYARDELEIFAKTIFIEEVGEDFYDYIMIDKTHLAFFLGDVKGVGLTAALMAVLTDTCMKNFARAGYHPGRVMSETNNTICRTKGLDQTVIAFFGILDLTTGELSYSGAGIEPPLWKHAGDDFTFLEGTESFSLGSMENTSFQSRMVRLTQGDIFVLYTEGISHAKNNRSIEYSREVLEQALTEMVKKEIHSEAIAEEAIEGVKQFAGDSKLEDDGTVMVMRYFGTAG